VSGPSPDDPLEATFGTESVAPEERRRLIRRTFEVVAPRYDLMNDLMSLGLHRTWKARFVDLAAPRPGETAIDLAGGTGDVAFRLAARGARVRVVDPSAEMMAVGRRRPGGDRVGWCAAEAEDLPFADASVDLVTIAFGIRNVTRLDRSLAEIHRVLRPGGRFLCLEFARPRAWFAPFYDLWSATALPALAAIVSGRGEAYRYLTRSIRRFPDRESFAEHVRRAGFVDVDWVDLDLGIVAIHRGRRADPAAVNPPST
jgi:demethylmenaquinone methyltransferase/2-methoxy-6-polyprenyl-1,4-benzoquinol methylase